MEFQLAVFCIHPLHPYSDRNLLLTSRSPMQFVVCAAAAVPVSTRSFDHSKCNSRRSQSSFPSFKNKIIDLSQSANSIEMAKVIKCNICGVKFPTFEAAWDHYIEVHVKKNFICSLCLEEFGDMYPFVLHWGNAHKNALNMKFYTRLIEMVSSKCKCHAQSGIIVIILCLLFDLSRIPVRFIQQEFTETIYRNYGWHSRQVVTFGR